LAEQEFQAMVNAEWNDFFAHQNRIAAKERDANEDKEWEKGEKEFFGSDLYEN
jgi:hypothetical protein